MQNLWGFTKTRDKKRLGWIRTKFGRQNRQDHIILVPAQLPTEELSNCGNEYIQDVNNTKSQPEAQAAPNSGEELLGAELWEIVCCHPHLKKRVFMCLDPLKFWFFTWWGSQMPIWDWFVSHLLIASEKWYLEYIPYLRRYFFNIDIDQSKHLKDMCPPSFSLFVRYIYNPRPYIRFMRCSGV